MCSSFFERKEPMEAELFDVVVKMNSTKFVMFFNDYKKVQDFRNGNLTGVSNEHRDFDDTRSQKLANFMEGNYFFEISFSKDRTPLKRIDDILAVSGIVELRAKEIGLV